MFGFRIPIVFRFSLTRPQYKIYKIYLKVTARHIFPKLQTFKILSRKVLSEFLDFILKILSLYIILLCTHLFILNNPPLNLLKYQMLKDFWKFALWIAPLSLFYCTTFTKNEQSICCWEIVANLHYFKRDRIKVPISRRFVLKYGCRDSQGCHD